MRLVKNEHIKIYSKKSIWVLYAIIAALCIIVCVIIKSNMPTESEDAWRQKAEENIKMATENIENNSMPESNRNQLIELKAISEYRLDNNMHPQATNSFWGFVQISSNFIALITMFVVVIGASSVSSEFSKGTIKLLLIRPHKRWKILLSKYVISYLFAFEMLAFLLLSSMLAGWLFFGGNGAALPFLAYKSGMVIETSMFLHILTVYGFACVQLFVMVTLAFMLSTLFRNNALAIGATIFLMFAGATIIQLLVTFTDVTWVKYILFANTDLTVYFEGTPLIEGMTLGFSIIVLLVYIVIFNVISWMSFCKRDVAA